MSDLEIKNLSDRELLILINEKLSQVCHKVDRHNKIILGNGVPGLRAQVWAMWGIFLLIATQVNWSQIARFLK